MSMTDVETIATATDADRFDAAFAEKPAVTADKPVAEVENERTDDGGAARDEQGRFKAKADGEPEPKVGADGKPIEPKPTTAEEPEHRIPLAEHLSVRERAQKAERERDDLDRRLRAIERERAEAAKPKRERPDLLADPDAYDEYVRQEVGERVSSVEQLVRIRMVDMTFAEAEEVHGEEFEKAFVGFQRAAGRQGVNDPQLFKKIVDAPNPGKALMRWHREREAVREIGGDIGKFRQGVLDKALDDPEFRKKAMDKWRTDANGGGSDKTGSNVTNLPSLNRATGAGADRSEPGDIGSDADRFSKVFSGKAR